MAVSGPPAAIERGAAIDSLSCPSSSRCTALDTLGSAVTFEPSDPHAKPATAVIAARNGGQPELICPSSSVCLAMPSGTSPPGAVIGATPGFTSDATWFDCPAVTTCVTVSTQPKHDEVTFNLLASTAAPVTGSLGVFETPALSCLSAAECVTTNENSTAVEFDPADPAARASQTIRGSELLSALSCPSDTEYVAADSLGDVFVGTS